MQILIKVILFDLGGVLVDWDGKGPLVGLSGGKLNKEEARRFWLESILVREFETGRLAPDQFAEGVVSGHSEEDIFNALEARERIDSSL